MKSFQKSKERSWITTTRVFALIVAVVFHWKPKWWTTVIGCSYRFNAFDVLVVSDQSIYLVPLVFDDKLYDCPLPRFTIYSELWQGRFIYRVFHVTLTLSFAETVRSTFFSYCLQLLYLASGPLWVLFLSLKYWSTNSDSLLVCIFKLQWLECCLLDHLSHPIYRINNNLLNLLLYSSMSYIYTFLVFVFTLSWP